MFLVSLEKNIILKCSHCSNHDAILTESHSGYCGKPLLKSFQMLSWQYERKISMSHTNLLRYCIMCQFVCEVQINWLNKLSLCVNSIDQIQMYVNKWPIWNKQHLWVMEVRISVDLWPWCCVLAKYHSFTDFSIPGFKLVFCFKTPYIAY